MNTENTLCLIVDIQERLLPARLVGSKHTVCSNGTISEGFG